MKATDIVPLSVLEVRRLVPAPSRQRHLLAWSHFRRISARVHRALSKGESGVFTGPRFLPS
ncbi:MAG: hypothetical protein ACLQUY_11555 [Ktedonobacterales bacterium]